MASLHRNSLTDERMTARPSPDLPQVVRKERVRGGERMSRTKERQPNLEYGVFPDPFSCSSQTSPFL